MPADPLATRVAQRHARDAAIVLRDVPPRSRVDLDCSGQVSAFDLRMALEPQTGWLRRLRFRPSQRPATAIRWEAATGNGQVVTGTLALRAAVREDEVATWAEVMVDG